MERLYNILDTEIEPLANMSSLIFQKHYLNLLSN